MNPQQHSQQQRSMFMHRFALLLLCFSQIHCGILLQTTLGWNKQQTQTTTADFKLPINSAPPGAEIARLEDGGQKQILGVTPLVDPISYQSIEITETPKNAGLIIGGILETLGAVALFVHGSNQGSRSSNDLFSDASNSFERAGFYTLGVLVGGLAVTDLILAITQGSQNERVARRQIQPTLYNYEARYPGLPTLQRTVRVPDQSRLEFVLDPAFRNQFQPTPPPAPNPNSATTNTDGRVIAVMNVEEAKNANQALSEHLLRSVTDQLRIFMAREGVQTVDRGAQEQVLREQIQNLKGQSYKACYDESCQIELGKALAASHILRAQLARFGSICVLNAELIDLKTEVTVRAASESGDCQEEAFFRMSEKVARAILRNTEKP